MSMQDLFTKTKLCSKCKLPKVLATFDTICRSYDKRYVFKSECRDCTRKREYKWTHGKGKKKVSEHNIKEKRQTRYGLNEKEYERMLIEQNNKCAICQREMIPASVDHNHDTGEIRDLLCKKCNSLIGLAGDDVELLQAAITYLRKWQ